MQTMEIEGSLLGTTSERSNTWRSFPKWIALACLGGLLVLLLLTRGSSVEDPRNSAVVTPDLSLSCGPLWQCNNQSTLCEDEGTYAPSQCYVDAQGKKMCGCVDPSGRWLLEVKPESNTSSSVCEALRQGCSTLSDVNYRSGPLLHCMEEKKAAEENDGFYGKFVPTCNADGTYAAYQCHGSTGYCWCSSPAGEEIEGTSFGPSTEQFKSADCERLLDACGQTKNCQRQRERAKASHRFGAFVPQCDGNGQFLAMQCHGSTGQCWCASVIGVKLPGTHNKIGVSEEQCQAERQLAFPRTACEIEWSLSVEANFIGDYVPDCKTNGDYAPMQCNETKTECWCVMKDGRELNNTHGWSNLTHELCLEVLAQVSDLEPCELFNQDNGVGLMCDRDGSFSARQCYDDQCWCVEKDGKEIFGTRGRPGIQSSGACKQLREICSVDTMDACLLEPSFNCNSSVVSSHYFFNYTSGKCEQYGMRGCALNSGNYFDSFDSCTTQCNHVISTLCSEELRVAEELLLKGLLGVRVPHCTKDGRWEGLQCHENSCFCVNQRGIPYPGTFHPSSRHFSERSSICEKLRRTCTSCEDDSQEMCTAHHQQLGVNCAIGSCIPVTNTFV